MVKLILYTFITVFLLKEVAAAGCTADQMTSVQTCYSTTFQKIQGRQNLTNTMYFDSYNSIYETAFKMWEGYQAICNVQSDLQGCLKGAGVESCINYDDMMTAPFVKADIDNAYSVASGYVLNYIKYNYLCSQLNNTNRDAYTCYRDNLLNPENILPVNCTNYKQTDINPDCFTYQIYLDCIANYATAVCGDQSKCMAQKLYTLDMCSVFGNKNQPTCGVCTSALVGSTDPVANVCTDTSKSQDNGSIIPTMSLSLLFFVTLVFQVLVKN